MIYTVGAVTPNDPEELKIPRFRFKAGGSTDTEEFPLTQEERNALTEGRAWLATHGRVEYWDVYNKSHWVQFCNWDSFKPGLQYSAQGCSEYNNTDGE
jgi:hypothetical protein